MAAAPVTDRLLVQFVESLERRRASCEVVTRTDAARASARWIADRGAVRAVLADDPMIRDIGLSGALRAAGVDPIMWPTSLSPREQLGLEGPDDVCGVTAPTLGVAERGTVVLEATPGHGRAIDVASRHHLAVLPADRIVATLVEALTRTYAPGRAIPSAVSLVSGPSRSSDIEKISTLGAHGALTEHVIIIL